MIEDDIVRRLRKHAGTLHGPHNDDMRHAAGEIERLREIIGETPCLSVVESFGEYVGRLRNAMQSVWDEYGEMPECFNVVRDGIGKSELDVDFLKSSFVRRVAIKMSKSESAGAKP